MCVSLILGSDYKLFWMIYPPKRIGGKSLVCTDVGHRVSGNTSTLEIMFSLPELPSDMIRATVVTLVDICKKLDQT